MDNQHRKIKGYRELTQAEVDLMNRVKAQGAELEKLVNECASFDMQAKALNPEDVLLVGRVNEANRWRAIAKTHFQEGLMALTRSVAKPEFF